LKKKIGIIGCGWLGLPLAEFLIDKGYIIHGTTTNINKLPLLEKEGINPYLINVSPSKIVGAIAAFLDPLEVLIINIPPKLRGAGEKESYTAKIELLHKAILESSVEKVIFISSTSVYGDCVGSVSEDTIPLPSTSSGMQLLECEQLLLNCKKLQSTILRLGGLIGPKRHPITMLSGKKGLKNGNAPVNLIHLNDCISIIYKILENDLFSFLYNVVANEHPIKQEYYRSMAQRRNLIPPSYITTEGKNFKKIISCKNFITKSSVNFTSIYE